MSSQLSALTLEGLPATGVYQSFNGRVYIGGKEIIRISNAVVRILRNPAKYAEVGTRYGTPYYRETRVAFSLTQAFVNFFPLIMSLGFPVSDDFVPGEIYTELGTGTSHSLLNLLQTVANPHGSKTNGGLNSDRPANYYPVHTDAEFVVNKDGVVSGDYLTVDDVNKDLSSPIAYEQAMLVKNAILDIGQIQIGAGGDLITSGPIDALGEEAVWTIAKFD